MASNESDHPHLLLWYVSGDLSADLVAVMESHLTRCPSCREEAQVMRSMLKVARAADREAREVARFKSSQTADGRTPEVDALPPARSSSVHWWPAACAGTAAGLLVGALALVSLPRQAPPDSATVALAPLQAISLLPQTRGVPREPVLSVNMPAAATVALPFDSPSGGYRARLDRGRDTRISMAAVISPDGSDRIALLIPPLSETGAWTLVLESAADETMAPIAYPFRVVDR